MALFLLFNANFRVFMFEHYECLTAFVIHGVERFGPIETR